ncbi:MAG: hypothetical protein ACLKAL_12015 [Alkaliphilus sp.]
MENKKWERKSIKIEELIVNPENARFVIPLTTDDEKIAIEKLCNTQTLHMDKLLRDISEKGLNPSELLIVMPSDAFKGKYEVMDGNRRTACVKLMLQYREVLDTFNIPNVIKEAVVKSQSYSFYSNIESICSSDKEYVNDLLEKLHTHNTGVSTVRWTPVSQERHNYKKGKLTKVNAIIRFLETSEHSNDEIKNNLNKTGWLTLFKRFIDNNKTTYYYFGFNFNKEIDGVNMFIDEKEIVIGLSHLLLDCINNPASLFVQKEEAKQAYLSNFELQQVVDMSKTNDPVLTFYVKDCTISASALTPRPSHIDNKQTTSDPEDIQPEDNNDTEDSPGTKEATPPKYTDTEKQKLHPQKVHKRQTTEGRKYLIPKKVDYKVTNQRTCDLLVELQNTYIEGHRNLISVGLRVFIEFSVSIFVEKNLPKKGENPDKLFAKIKYSVEVLNKIHGERALRDLILPVYNLIHSKNSEVKDTTILNFFVHHYKFHPTATELKTLYNNYEPYLKLLWDNINNVNQPK